MATLPQPRKRPRVAYRVSVNRAVRATTMMKALSWLLAIGSAVALNIILSLANQDLAALNQLLKSGKLAQAWVTDRHMNSGKSTTYYLSY